VRQPELWAREARVQGEPPGGVAPPATTDARASLSLRTRRACCSRLVQQLYAALPFVPPAGAPTSGAWLALSHANRAFVRAPARHRAAMLAGRCAPRARRRARRVCGPVNSLTLRSRAFAAAVLRTRCLLRAFSVRCAGPRAVAALSLSRTAHTVRPAAPTGTRARWASGGGPSCELLGHGVHSPDDRPGQSSTRTHARARRSCCLKGRSGAWRPCAGMGRRLCLDRELRASQCVPLRPL